MAAPLKFNVQRPCGDCRACCTPFHVVELRKPPGVPCPHLTGTGCGIYQDRPWACRRFSCLWREGFGQTRDRPDRVGIVVEVLPLPRGDLAVATEVEPGNSTKREARRVLETIAEITVVIVCKPGGALVRVMGPDEMVRSVMGAIRRGEIAAFKVTPLAGDGWKVGDQ